MAGGSSQLEVHWTGHLSLFTAMLSRHDDDDDDDNGDDADNDNNHTCKLFVKLIDTGQKQLSTYK